MKISPYMKLNRIEFMVTHQCSGACIHCSIGDKLNKINKNKFVSLQDAINTVEKLTEMFEISSIMTFGGEPLLYPDVVCAIHKTADLCGIGEKQLITNGYFSNDDQKCREVANSLRDAGLNNLLLSVDAFHQRTIPVEPVYRFAEYAQAAGISNINLHPCWVIDAKHNNIYNIETKDILKQFSRLHIPISSGNNVFMAGRAVENLAEYYEKPNLDLTSICGSQPYTQPLTDITSISIVPSGDVQVCAFTIGNIYTESIEDIIARYNPYENEFMNAIICGGASALITLADEKGLSIDYSKCYSLCDLCHKLYN